MSGVRSNGLSGTADCGNTTSSWNTSGTTYLRLKSGSDPGAGVVTWASQSKYEGWMNTQLGYSQGRYLNYDFIEGVTFRWRTYPNQDGGIALKRWGIGIVNDSGTKKRWSSNDINSWSTSSSWRAITYKFDGTLLNYFKNSGYRFNELHFMVHTPSNGSHPSSECRLEIGYFTFLYRCPSNAIIPAVRPYSERKLYAIAS